MLKARVDRRNAEAGFVVSAELMLIAVILLVGSITAWVKLRDQSVAEVIDSVNALDAYNVGVARQLQPFGTRWISGGLVQGPAALGPVVAVSATAGAPFGTIAGQYVPPASVATTSAGGEDADVVIP
jgi:hypothetical protein